MSSDKPPPPPPVFEESSQYQHWRFSPKQLWDIRNKCTEAAVKRVKRNVQEEQAALEREYLDSNQELLLCRFYEMQLQAMSKHCKFTDLVMATAVIYMKRFFLYNTVMDYHPKDIFLTCLFLATKSESERISIQEFGKNLRLPNTTSVLDLEFTVSQGLKFQYYIHHPYRPAYGFFLDMQKTNTTDLKILKETFKKVTNNTIAEIVLTDLPLIYQPSQLALAAFIIAGEVNGFKLHVEKYIQDRFGDGLLYIIEKIIKEFKQVLPVTKDEAKLIDYKLKLCKPAESDIYKKRLVEKEQGESKKAKTTVSDSSSSASSDS